MRSLAGAALTVALVCGIASAGAASGATKSANPALIEELCQAMDLEKAAEQSADVMLKALEAQMPEIMGQILGPVDPNSPRAVERRKEAAEFQTRFNKRYRELLAERVHLGKLTKEIYSPLFDKHYTEEEIRGLITFYKSPLGKKVLGVMPVMMGEAMAKSQELVNPKIMECVQTILAEEKARADAKKAATSPTESK